MSEILATPVIDPAPAKSIDGFWLYLLFALLATAGFFYINIMAAIVDGLITGLGFSNAQAGMVGSANIYGASVGALSAVFVVRRIEWRQALVVLFAILIAIDLASTLIHTPNILIAVRAVHGFIGGMTVGIVYSVMARLHSPDRAFGVLLVLQFGLGGLGVMFLPQLVPLYGARILFLVLAALTAIALVSMLAIPKRLGKNRSNAELAAIPANYRKLTVVLALAALFLF
ncbi:MAG: MFS transporter, partial [Dokdonella sp.]